MNPPESHDHDAEGPEALLDALRDHPEWSEDQRESVFNRLIERVPLAALAAIVGPRLRDLSGGDGEALLRLVDADGSAELLDALAVALIAQPDLPPERAWAALDLLDAAGRLDASPELAEWRDELAEMLDDDRSLVELAAQLEDGPDGTWLALQGLGAVEPEVRAEIVAGLGLLPAGPGLVRLLRLLAFAHDPTTREAALAALERRDDAHSAWAAIAADHDDPEVVARARRRLGGTTAIALVAGTPPVPRVSRSLVTAIDGRGRGHVVLAAEHEDEAVVAAFLCDVSHGVVEVVGQTGRDTVAGFLAEFAARPERDAVTGADELALGLLAGSLLLCEATTPPALRYWLERTAGPGFRPRPFWGTLGQIDPADLPITAIADAARAVLDATGWVDDSALTDDLAREVWLRDGSGRPDPGRDAGVYRYLFEHCLAHRLEAYRRMLVWMALFWDAAATPDLAQAARVLAWQLSDPQHAVPGHPFAIELTTRSLTAARKQQLSTDTIE